MPRQNGKGEVLLARELAGLFLFDERLIIHTAHEFKTAAEAFLRIKTVIENCDELRKLCRKPREANGEQGIETLTGNRLRFLARSKGSGRGFSGDLVILDEAYELPVAAMGALLPTMSARPNPQLWYASSAGHPHSDVLHGLRVRGAGGSSPGLCYLEWSAPDNAADDDPAAWAQANPALGIRIRPEHVRLELEGLREAGEDGLREFRRERLGIWEDETALAVIDAATWAGLTDRDSTIDGRAAFAVDVTPDHAWSSIAAAGGRRDGKAHVEVVDHRPGTRWVVPYLQRLVETWRPYTVVLDPAGPAGALIPDLDTAKVPYTLTTARDVGQACGAFYTAATQDQLRHLGVGADDQPELAAAVAGAVKRTLGEAWAWDRKKTNGSNAVISPLVATTLALWGYLTNHNEQGGWLVILP